MSIETATCHPEKRAYRRGACQACYNRWLYSTNTEYRQRVLLRNKRYKAAHVEELREYKRQYHRDGRVHRIRTARQAPIAQQRVYQAVRTALAAGRLTRRPCEQCGELLSMAHHGRLRQTPRGCLALSATPFSPPRRAGQRPDGQRRRGGVNASQARAFARWFSECQEVLRDLTQKMNVDSRKGFEAQCRMRMIPLHMEIVRPV
ncbi:hypothetical protein LCGC14_2552710, partial [marine sediment metagenome]